MFQEKPKKELFHTTLRNIASFSALSIAFITFSKYYKQTHKTIIIMLGILSSVIALFMNIILIKDFYLVDWFYVPIISFIMVVSMFIFEIYCLV